MQHGATSGIIKLGVTQGYVKNSDAKNANGLQSMSKLNIDTLVLMPSHFYQKCS